MVMMMIIIIIIIIVIIIIIIIVIMIIITYFSIQHVWFYIEHKKMFNRTYLKRRY